MQIDKIGKNIFLTELVNIEHTYLHRNILGKIDIKINLQNTDSPMIKFHNVMIFIMQIKRITII